jgi:hypothetical protein
VLSWTPPGRRVKNVETSRFHTLAPEQIVGLDIFHRTSLLFAIWYQKQPICIRQIFALMMRLNMVSASPLIGFCQSSEREFLITSGFLSEFLLRGEKCADREVFGVTP